MDTSDTFGKEFDRGMEDKLNSILFSHFNITSNPGETSLQSLGQFRHTMRGMLFGMMRGRQNASELVPNMPFWLNSEKRCVESAAKILIHFNQTKECRPNCLPVKWEDTLFKAFMADCKLVKR